MDRHPGIRIDSIPVAGAAGFIFAVGVVAITLVGLPALRPLLFVMVVGGALGGLALRLWREYR